MKVVVIGLVLMSLWGCSSNTSRLRDYRQSVNYDTRSSHFYIEQLAKQLFEASQNVRRYQTVAVGTFLPLDKLSGDSLPPHNPLGQQLQESFVTLSTQAGMRVVEFRTTRTIMLHHDQDVMLSRDMAEMAMNAVATDYYLTGTFATTEAGVIVNARLIDVATNNVVAASTGRIPVYVLGGLANRRYNARSHVPMYQLTD